MRPEQRSVVSPGTPQGRDKLHPIDDATETLLWNSAAVCRGAAANVPDEVQSRVQTARVEDRRRAAGFLAREVRRFDRIREQRE